MHMGRITIPRKSVLNESSFEDKESIKLSYSSRNVHSQSTFSCLRSLEHVLSNDKRKYLKI